MRNIVLPILRVLWAFIAVLLSIAMWILFFVMEFIWTLKVKNATDGPSGYYIFHKKFWEYNTNDQDVSNVFGDDRKKIWKSAFHWALKIR